MEHKGTAWRGDLRVLAREGGATFAEAGGGAQSPERRYASELPTIYVGHFIARFPLLGQSITPSVRDVNGKAISGIAIAYVPEVSHAREELTSPPHRDPIHMLGKMPQT
jgi:hypothetical protein